MVAFAFQRRIYGRTELIAALTEVQKVAGDASIGASVAAAVNFVGHDKALVLNVSGGHTDQGDCVTITVTAREPEVLGLSVGDHVGMGDTTGG